VIVKLQALPAVDAKAAAAVKPLGFFEARKKKEDRR